VSFLNLKTISLLMAPSLLLQLYAFQFEGTTGAAFDTLVWKSYASLRCKIFS
jgi:hypothetical protein